jgi:muramidase (phage lysozyme)
MVLTIPAYKPLIKISDIAPGAIAHPAGKGVINFNLRVLTRYGEVLIDFGQFGDLLSWRDSLSVEGASGSWTIRMRASLCNETLLKKLHPGLVVEVYCARNDDPLIGVVRDPSKIPRIDTSPRLPEFAQTQAESTATSGPISVSSSTTADTTMTARRRAFLDTIAYSEGADYNVQFTGSKFGNYTDHPRQIKRGGGFASDAAGRYQFLSTTWDGAKSALGLTDFSPANQDKAGIYLVQQRGALVDVDAGNFEAAINKCAQEWASFPGSPYGQPTHSMAKLKAVYEQALAKYGGAGSTGTPAPPAGPVAPTKTIPTTVRVGYTAKMYDSTTDVVITDYSQMSRHHTNRGIQPGRSYATVNGKLEEVTISKAGNLVKKDYVLEDAQANRFVPKYVGVSGYVGNVGDGWGAVSIYADKERTSLIARLGHMDNILVKSGDVVAAGQHIGRQSNVGMNGGAIHSHDEYRFEDWNRAIAIQNSGGNGSVAGANAPVTGAAGGGTESTGFGLAAGQDPIGPAVQPIEDPYLDKCPHLLMRGIITDYGRSTDDSTSLTISGESYGAIYKDAFMLVDLQAPELASKSFEWRASSKVPLGVSFIYYTILQRWVENFWGQTTGWEARTRPIPFPPNYMTRINSEGSAWSNLQWLSIEGFFHIFVDHTGAICWEKLPWSSKNKSLITGRNWEDLQLLELPSWKIKSWNDRLSGQGVNNFIRCVPTQQGQAGGGNDRGVEAPALIYNMGSIRQYGGPSKREINFPVGTGGEADQYYTAATNREAKATISTFTSLCALECVRWYDRPVQRCGVTVRGESAWRINTRVKLTENWHCPDAKPAEYYVVSRSHTINISNGAWETSLEMVRDRRNRYLGIGVGEVPIVLDPKTPVPESAKISTAGKASEIDKILGKGAAASESGRFTATSKLKAGSPVAALKNYQPPNEKGELAVVEIPEYLKVPLVPDEYYFFDRLSAKIVAIGNDPYVYAQKEVIPKMGVQSGTQVAGPVSVVGAGPKTIVGKKNEAIAKAAKDLGGFSTKGENNPIAPINKVFDKAEVILPWQATTVSVRDAEAALKAGGIVVPTGQVKAGDIAIMGDAEAIGVAIEDGGVKVRSNSAAKASFSWDTDADTYDKYFTRGKIRYYRLSGNRDDKVRPDSQDQAYYDAFPIGVGVDPGIIIG